MTVRRPTVHDEAVMGPSKAENAVTVFQWVKTVSPPGNSESRAVTRRFDAEYQVLCRFVIVLGLVVLTWSDQDFLRTVILLVPIASRRLAFWRYMERHYTATNQAYWLAFTLRVREAAPAARRVPPVES